MLPKIKASNHFEFHCNFNSSVYGPYFQDLPAHIKLHLLPIYKMERRERRKEKSKDKKKGRGESCKALAVQMATRPSTSALSSAGYTPGLRCSAISTAKTHLWKKTGYYCGGSCLKQPLESVPPWNLNEFIKLCCAPRLAINHSPFQALLINTKARNPVEAPNFICSTFELLLSSEGRDVGIKWIMFRFQQCMAENSKEDEDRPDEGNLGKASSGSGEVTSGQQREQDGSRI